MFDKDTENIITSNILQSFPIWMHCVKETMIFKDLATAFIEYLSSFSSESRDKLVFVKSNFDHFCENDSKIILLKKQHEESLRLAEKEKNMKILYSKHLEQECEAFKTN